MLVSVDLWESQSENGLGAKIKSILAQRQRGPRAEAASTRTHDRPCPMEARFGS